MNKNQILMPLSIYSKLNFDIANLMFFWTQGAGGNVSLKLNDTSLIIKASGYRLNQVTDRSGWVCLDFLNLRKKLSTISSIRKDLQEKSYSEAIYRSQIERNDFKDLNNFHDPRTMPLRASMESGFHAISPFKWVMHFHSLPAILMGHYQSTVKFKEWKDKYSLNHQINFIPLAKPGWELSNFFYTSTSQYNIVKNHGVILQSDSEEILNSWSRIEDLFLHDFNFNDLLELKHILKTKKPPSAPNSLNWQDLNKTKELHKFYTGPIKFYFPDFAIYFKKLQEYLIPAPPIAPTPTSSKDACSYLLIESAPQDLHEIWLGTQTLYQTLPKLAQIPESFLNAITELPTEILRQSFIK